MTTREHVHALELQRAQDRQIIADLYDELRAYAVDIHDTENKQVWNALRNARKRLWPDMEPDSADPENNQDQDQDQSKP